MKDEMDSIDSNSVWKLEDLPEGIKPIGCKWIYKKKRHTDGKVETYNARLVAKGYTQKKGINYEQTFSLVVMLKPIYILLYIAATLDYEIWQIGVKTTFLNGYLEESIYMIQPTRYIAKGHEHKVCKLLRSIYGLKQYPTFGLEQNIDGPCVYKHIGDGNVVFLILYVDDVLHIGNDVGTLSLVKLWLTQQFSLKDLGEVNFILGI
ncbi:gag/pol protein [Gossypium australe]|uniref:Gag/pol protein n=1 Tax=Gossypium australe TaxID=47621 RepID=A0A5B6W9M7_9ROSI|nr:gag/pol protein [Gossypium australe]